MTRHEPSDNFKGRPRPPLRSGRLSSPERSRLTWTSPQARGFVRAEALHERNFCCVHYGNPWRRGLVVAGGFTTLAEADRAALAYARAAKCLFLPSRSAGAA